MSKTSTIPQVDGPRLLETGDPQNETEARWLQDMGMLPADHPMAGQPVIYYHADGSMVSNDPMVAARQQLQNSSLLESMIQERALAIASQMVADAQQGAAAVSGENTGRAFNAPVALDAGTETIFPSVSHESLSGTGMPGDPDNEKAARPVGVPVSPVLANLKPGRRYEEGKTVEVEGEGEQEVPPYDQWDPAGLRSELANRGLSTGGNQGAMVKRLEQDDARYEASQATSKE